jgi:hypothetical protein
VKKVCGDKALKKTQLYEIIRKVKEGKQAADHRLFNGKRRIRDPTFVADITAQVANDRRVTVRKLCEAHGVSTRIIHATLHDDLHLSKKSARWVPKLLSQDMKNERVRTCGAFLSLVRHHSKAMLERIVTMDESAVSFHTPQTKQKSKQWLVKGAPGWSAVKNVSTLLGPTLKKARNKRIIIYNHFFFLHFSRY